MISRRPYLLASFLAAAILLLAGTALAQFGRRGGGFGIGGRVSSTSDMVFPEHGEFHYLRLEYVDYNGNRGFNGSRRGQGNGWWAQDFPDTENHFSFALTRLTNLSVGKPVHLPWVTGKGEDEIFDYPWVYITQNGYWDAAQDEIEKMREFFARGGFMMTDDTWGAQERASFEDIMQEVFPDREVVDMGEQDTIMHVMYDIQDKDRTYIPGQRHLGYNGEVRNVGAQPRWMAIHDDKQRVIVAVNYDTDIGDAWEYADAPYYPEHMTTLAYHYGINYLVYAMTH